MEVVLIGLGGIGSVLAPALARYLHYGPESHAGMVFVDGDAYDARNRPRQNFRRIGNKARRTAEELASEFEDVSFRAVEHYVDADNIAGIVVDESIVLLAVDNHATRKLVSDYCSSLPTVTLLSGGNDFTDGNVQVYIRREGQALTQPLTAFHPEIAMPLDRSPAERGCEVMLEEGVPQLLFTNMAVASALLNAFYAIVHLGTVEYDEVYLDIVQARMTPVRRSSAQNE